MLLEPSKINDNLLNKEEIEMVQEKHHEYKLIRKMTKVNGHTLFSFNLVTKEIKVAAVLKCKDLIWNNGLPIPTENDKIIIENNCFYEQALNLSNFKKRLKRKGMI